MKIAFLTTDNRQAFRQYENPTPWFGPAPYALLQGFAQIPSVEVHIVSCTQRRMPPSRPQLTDNIFFHSLHVPNIGWMRTGYLGCIQATRRKLREIAPDIVHGQGTERDCAISAIFSGYPNVVTIHGNMRVMAQLQKAPPLSFYWLAARLEAFTLPRTDGVVCITNYTRGMVAAEAKRTWVVPNAVDGSFFSIELQPVKPPRLICVANVDERKNQNALIRAVDPLDPTRRIELIFLGLANPKDAYARKFLEIVKTRPWCSYRGYANRQELQEYLASASGLVLPSLEDNCPMVVLEAMAAGVPVAAAAVGGVPELIRQGETGLLFDPSDREDMIGAVRELLTPRSFERAARAKEEAWERFLPEVIARQHLTIYEEVLSSGG